METLIIVGSIAVAFFFIWRFATKKKPAPGTGRGRGRAVVVVAPAPGHATTRRSSRLGTYFKLLLFVNIVGLSCCLVAAWFINREDEVDWYSKAAVLCPLVFLLVTGISINVVCDEHDRYGPIRIVIGLCWLFWFFIAIFGQFGFYNDVPSPF